MREDGCEIPHHKTRFIILNLAPDAFSSASELSYLTSQGMPDQRDLYFPSVADWRVGVGKKMCWGAHRSNERGHGRAVKDGALDGA